MERLVDELLEELNKPVKILGLPLDMLIEEYQRLEKENKQLEKERGEAKCKSKGLKAWQLYAIVSHLEEELKNCIPKSVIREKIEELERLEQNPKEAKHYVAWYSRKIETLKELLGEEK